MKTLFDALKVDGAGGFVGLVEHHKAERVVLDAVPHGGVVGVRAVEVGLHGQHVAGVAR